MDAKTEPAAEIEEELDALRRRVADLERELAEAHRAAESLESGSQRLAAAVSHAPIVVWTVDRSGVFTLSEGLGLETIGLRPGEVVGRDVFEMYSDSPEVSGAVRRALLGEEFTYIIDVQGLAFKTWLSPLRDAAGEIVGVIGVSTDITPHIRAERALREAEENLRSILENVPDTVFTIDRQGVILSMNHVGPQYERERVVGSNVYDYILADHGRNLTAAIEAVLRTGEPQRYEVLAKNGTGSESWFACRIGPIRQEGRIAALAGTATDVTDRKNAEEKLRRACDELEGRIADRTAELVATNERLQREIEQRMRAEADSRRQTRILQSVLDSMGDGLIVADQDVRLLLLNPAGAELLGIDQAQAADANWSWFEDAFLPDMVTPYPPRDRPIVRAIQGASIADEEIFFRRPGQIEGRWFQVSARPLIDERGAQNGGVVVFREIGKQKLAETALRSEQRFLRQLLDVHERDRQLTAYEIHDGLMQYVPAALLHLEGLGDKQPKLSTKCRETLELATHLLRRAIHEGRRVMNGLRPPILDEAGVVLAIADLIAEQSVPGELQIELTHRVSFDRLEPLLEQTIFRIVQEALNNVKRHSRASRAEVKLCEQEGRLHVEVRDWGAGFDPRQTSQDRFGLEGIRKRAALMGGEAKIETTLGQGTRVLVDLPLKPAIR